MKSFVMCNADIFSMGLDCYDIAYYLRIVLKARNNPEGYYESAQIAGKILKTDRHMLYKCRKNLEKAGLIRCETMYKLVDNKPCKLVVIHLVDVDDAESRPESTAS